MDLSNHSILKSDAVLFESMISSIKEMNLIEQKQISNALYILSAIAMLSVIMAHCVYSNPDVQIISDMLGTIGVPLFLIKGGYYYKKSETFSVFAKKKIKRIVVPWAIWGFFTYLLHVIRDGVFSFVSLTAWIIGYKTWLYYVPVLLICYLIFRISTKKVFCIIVATIGLILYYLNVFGYIYFPFITDCQNVFNWISFFSLGVLLQNNSTIPYIYKKRKILLGFALGISVFLGILYLHYCKTNIIKPSYWTLFSIPFELSCFFSTLLICFNCASVRCPLLIGLGKNTYIIFFAHMQIGINIVNLIFFQIWNKNDFLAFAMLILRPLAVLCVTYFFFVYLLNTIGKKLNLSKYLWVIGL